MRIGELSAKTGLTKDTIRWYEKIGLITLDQRSRSGNNYRNYSSEVLERLLFIRQVKLFGFTLNEVRALLNLNDEDELNCQSASEIIEPRLKMIDEKIAELKNLKYRLVTAKENCTGNCKAVLTTDIS